MIEKRLYKQFNELCFRYFLFSEVKHLIPLSHKTTSNDILFIKQQVLELFGVDEYDIVKEFSNICDDILSFIFGINVDLQSASPKSKFLSEIMKNVHEKSIIVNDSLKVAYKHNSHLEEVVTILMKHDDNACLVGGSIRDILVERTPKDFDFVTKLDYDILTNIFKENGYNINETGKQFMVLAITKDNETYEIANFRKDGTYNDGRRPDSVDIGTIYDDAHRRDFTINALYFELSTKIILDPTGCGVEDTDSKTLKFVGNPRERLEEDLLRCFRFYRFVSKGYEPHKQSLRAVRNFFDKACKEVASERIKSEIERIVKV